MADEIARARNGLVPRRRQHRGIRSGTPVQRRNPGPPWVIVVTTNYRLGIFGFFSHPELTKESPHHASGNYGLADQIQVFRWAQQNIARFGGNPANVTMFGELAAPPT